MDTGILYRKGTRYLIIPFAIAFFVISILVGLLYGGYFNKIDVLFKQDNEARLNDLSMQTVRVIEEKFKSNMKVLEQISSVLYNSEDFSPCPDIISGVLASSIRTESTSSIITKLNGL